MTAAAEALEPVIEDAQIVAGHDGAAELVVRLRHPNGKVHPVVLDARAGFRLMGACGVSDLSGLAGRSWRMMLEEG